MVDSLVDQQLIHEEGMDSASDPERWLSRRDKASKRLRGLLVDWLERVTS